MTKEEKSKYNKEIWYPQNKTTHGKQVRRNSQRYKEQAFTFIIEYLKVHPCVDCGETDIRVLDFDHVIGIKTYAVARLLGYHSTTNKLELEIAKCEVRCANCHRKKTSDTRNWFKSKRGYSSKERATSS